MLFKALAIWSRLGGSWLLTTLLVLFTGIHCEAQRMTINRPSIAIADVLELIKQKTGVQLLYSPTVLADAPSISINCTNTDIRQILTIAFSGLQLGFVADAGKFSIYRKVGLDASLYVPLEGRVQNSDGEPLEGASITVDSIPPQCSRAGGLFHLPMKGRRAVISISFQGYSTRTICLSNDEFQVVSLQPTSSVLDQAVVQAYGKTTTRLAAGSVVTVKGSDIAAQPSANILEALEGRVAGLTIRQNNGVPGSAYTVLIRGRQSISQGTDPLVVVDGVPIPFNDGYPGTIGAGSAQGSLGASDLNGIPPSAIASIEVLKGAAATAIYGSRGSNGVLLLTLKTGAAGRIKWDADLSSGIDQAVKTSALLNTKQYLDLRKEAVQNDGLPVNATTVPEAYLWDSTRYTNFKQLVTGHTRARENVRIGLSGGDTNTVFLLSGNYRSEAAVFPGASKDQRESLYGHLHHQSVNRRLRIDLSALYSWEDNLLPMQDYTYYQLLAPNAPAFRDSAGPSWSDQGISYLNIPALQNNSYRASVSNAFNHLQVSYEVLPGLDLRSSIGYYRIGSEERSQQTIAGQNPAFDPTGQTNYTANAGHSELVEGLAEYTRQGRRSKLEALVGVNWQGQWSSYSVVDAIGYTSDLLLNTGGGKPVISTDANKMAYKYEAVFGRINYVFDNRFIATFSDRRDGSSRFGPGNQFGNFWAIGGAWIFSEESFIRPWPWLSFGKLRGSIGTTGNDQIGANAFAQVYTGTQSARGYQGLQGVIPTTLANNDLRWEVNYNSELALDLGVLQNKVLLSAIAYRDWTVNQLVYTSLASQSGLPGVVSNVPANVVNEGLEFSLQTYNWTSGSFRWVSSFSLTVPVNRLARFPGMGRLLYANPLVIGKSLSVVKGYHYEGVNSKTGLFQFQDINHDDTLNVKNQVAGGNFDLRYYGGCNQSFRYKHWQLDLYFEFRAQNGVNPYVILYQENPPGFSGPSMLNNAPVEWLHRWRHVGDHAVLQQATESTGSAAYGALSNYIASDAKVTDASFIRWKSMVLSYRLPEGLLRRKAVQECRVYLQGQNLLTYTHFPVTDPETQDPTVLPPVRTLVAGIQLKF